MSLHVPKTGGTSLRNFFTELYGPENTYFYLQEEDSIVRVDQEGGLKNPGLKLFRNALLTTEFGRDMYLLLINTARVGQFLRPHISEEPVEQSSVPDTFSVIHGHFQFDRFADVESATHVTVLREPLERTVSEFQHYRWMASVGFKMPEWFDPNMDFLDFSFHEHMQNRQSQLTSGNLDKFEKVGVTHKLESYARSFDPSGKIKLGRVNKASTRIKKPLITPDIELQFKIANEEDYDLFKQAVERVDQKTQTSEVKIRV